MKWCGKSAPRSGVTRAARQTPPAARPNSGTGSQDPRPQPGASDPRVGCGDENPEACGNARSREMIASPAARKGGGGNRNRLTRSRDITHEAGRFIASGFAFLSGSLFPIALYIMIYCINAYDHIANTRRPWVLQRQCRGTNDSLAGFLVAFPPLRTSAALLASNKIIVFLKSRCNSVKLC